MIQRTLVASLVAVLAACGGCGDNNGTTNNGSNNGPNNGTNNGSNNGTTPSNNGTTANNGAAVTYHRDIAPLLQKNCVGCHRAGAIGPFGFETYEDVEPLADLIKQVTSARIMPPFPIDNTGACGKFDIPYLEDDEIALIGSWVDDGMPEGDPADNPGPYAEPLGLADVDAELAPAEAYTPRADQPDDYRCFLVDNPLTTAQMITSFEVVPGAAEIVHHVILYDPLDAAGVAEGEAFDAAEEGPGYECFGGPRISQGGNILAGWVPGLGVTHFPDQTGLRLAPNRRYILQIHYNTLTEPPAPDVTTVKLAVTDPGTVVEAYTVPFLNWNLVLPPGVPDVEATTDISFGLPLDVTIWGIIPHMHTRGRSMTVEIVRDGESYCGARLPRWDFNWQNFYFYREPIVFKRNDRVRVRCSYDTSEDSELVGWGDGTQDEMCFGVIYATLGPDTTAVDVSTLETLPDYSGVESVGTAPTVSPLTQIAGRAGDEVRGMVRDAGGNLFVLLQVTGGGAIDPGTGTAIDIVDRGPIVVRIGPDGTTQWATPLDGAGPQNAWAIVMTPSQTLAVTVVSATPLDLGGTTFTPDGTDGFLVELDPATGAIVGTPEQMGGPGNDPLIDVAYGPDGSRYASQNVATATTFGASSLSDDTIALRKWDPDGTPAWAVDLPRGGASYINGLSVATDGTVLLVGRFDEGLTVDGAYTQSAGRSDAFALFVAPDGTTKKFIHEGRPWSDEFAYSIATPDGGFLVSATMGGPLQLVETEFVGGMDAHLLKFDTDGNVQWARSFGGSGWDVIWGLDVAPNGEIVAALSYDAPVSVMGDQLYAAGLTDTAVVRLSPAGDVLSAQRFGSDRGDWWPAVAATDDSAWLALNTAASVDWHGASWTNQGGEDTYVFRLDY